MALSQITLEKGSYVQNCEVSYNSLIFEGFIQIQKPQGFDIFSGLSFASPLSLIFSPEHKGRVSVRYFVVPFSFQCLPSLCHFINSAAREQKKEKMKVREFKANPKLFKSKEKKISTFTVYCQQNPVFPSFSSCIYSKTRPHHRLNPQPCSLTPFSAFQCLDKILILDI